MLLSAASAAADTAVPAAVAGEPPWQERFDLDGDGKRDRIEVSYSGGAHCCYTLAVALSSGRRIKIPFEMDGGYVGGLDLSQKYHFDVFTQSGPGQPDEPVLMMMIATYGGRPTGIPKEWRTRYGVRSHFIAVHLRGGRMRVENLLRPPQR